MKLVFKRILFYFLSFTWGILMSIIGLIAVITALPFGKAYLYHGRLGVKVGEGWGGVSLGCFFLIGKDCESCAAHECGHGLQNIILGPLFPFVIALPSAIRYWYFTIYEKKHSGKWPEPYDAAWFEHWATEWGRNLVATDKC